MFLANGMVNVVCRQLFEYQLALCKKSAKK